jgi:hypothetical protein
MLSGRNESSCGEPSGRVVLCERDDTISARAECGNRLFRSGIASHRDDEVDVTSKPRLGSRGHGESAVTARLA